MRRSVQPPSTVQAALAAYIAGAALLLLACGGGSDSLPTPAPDAEATAANLVAQGDQAKAVDVRYAKDACLALNTYVEASLKLFERFQAGTATEAQEVKAMAPVLESLATTMSKLTPPRDAKAYHDKLVAALKDTAARLSRGEITTFQALGSVGNTSKDALPPDVRLRLAAAEQLTPECNQGQLQGIGGLFTD